MLAGAGVDEFKLPCVQTLTAQTLFRTRCAVGEVAQKRVTDVRHMHPYLMRSARLKAASDMGVAVVARDDLPMRHGIARILIRHRHALAVGRVPADGSVDGSAIVTQPALYNRLIHPRKTAVG